MCCCFGILNFGLWWWGGTPSVPLQSQCMDASHPPAPTLHLLTRESLAQIKKTESTGEELGDA